MQAEDDAAPKSHSASRLARELLSLAAFALLLFAARSSLADHYVIPSGSMEYTLLPGDRVLVDKRAYGTRIPFTWLRLLEGERPKPGEVVIFDSPEDGTRLIKRVVGRAGNVVQLHAGHLSIDGVPQTDLELDDAERIGERLAHLNLSLGGGPDVAQLRIPSGKLLVIGDARGNSRDGRFFGMIDEDAVYGRAIARYYRSGSGLDWEPL